MCRQMADSNAVPFLDAHVIKLRKLQIKTATVRVNQIMNLTQGQGWQIK